MKTILSLIGVVIVVGGIWMYYGFNKYAPRTYITQTVTPTGTTTVTTDTVSNTTTAGSPIYTMTQVSEHKDASSCYSVISGVVYDLTMWINMHPGGKSAILSICGIDGTEKFMNKHHGAQKQMDILARFKIGLLTQ